MMEFVVSFMLIIGGAFGVIGAFGLIRMPDVLIRMHASAKIGTLSALLILGAAALWFGDAGITVRVIMIVVFLFFDRAHRLAHDRPRRDLHRGAPLARREQCRPRPQSPCPCA
ncbi:MAG: monovalent cation/H(+) antiporter subunit G [Pseudomonadota bacterium]